MSSRPALAAGLFAGILAVFCLLLWNIQIVHGAEYAQTARRSFVETETVPAARGRLLDRKGRVLEWTVKRTVEQGRTIVVEWFFRCCWEEAEDGFDGVTVADFDEAGKIVRLSEFQSKAEHIFPYGE